MSVQPPPCCLLCQSTRPVRPAGFRQQYRQAMGPTLPVAWWECPECHGWFACPVPSVEAIRSNWGTVSYADPAEQPAISDAKRGVTRRILAGLAKRGRVANLLDVGCSTGLFMLAAKEAGWTVTGLDPNEAAVAVARDRGLDVQQGWLADDCPFNPGEFQAITAIDVFYYSWHPFRDLAAFARLLAPGGVLAMRLTNKRWILGLLRRVLPEGPQRDATLSRIVQGQFHSISLPSLTRILRQFGFAQVHWSPHAATAPLRSLSMPSLAAYFVSDVVRWSTLGRLDLSPGVLLFARKDY